MPGIVAWRRPWNSARPQPQTQRASFRASGFPMAVQKQLASLLNPLRFIVSYHDRSTLLQKIDRNKERVFSTPLNYASLNTCKGVRIECVLSCPSHKACFGRKRCIRCNELLYLPQVEYQLGLVGCFYDADNTFCFECL